MASVLLYLALSACATTAVGVFAGAEAWESWNEEHHTHCTGAHRSGVHVGSVVVRAESRGGCHRHAAQECDARSDRRCDDD